MKIALVHDYLHTYGGAEKVLEGLHKIYSDAPVFTGVYYPEKMPKSFQSWDIRPTYLQKVPRELKSFLKPLYPNAFEHLDLSEYDVVISSSAGVAKGIGMRKKLRPKIHIAYTHTPPRLAWKIDEGRDGFIENFISDQSRKWDLKASKRVDYFIANSEVVQKRIKHFYGKESVIINPPINIKELYKASESIEKKDYFVFVGRLETYKGPIEIAKAVNELDLKLKIIGTGLLEEELKKFGPNIEVLGFVSEEEKEKIVAESKAMVFWAYEDFGIVMAESLALGTPVIAYKKGGATEILSKNTGEFYDEQKIENLLEAVKSFDTAKFDKDVMQKSVEKYSSENFEKKIKDFVEFAVKDYENK